MHITLTQIARLTEQERRKASTWLACTSSALSGTSRAALTTSCAGAVAGMALQQGHWLHIMSLTLNLNSIASLAEQERRTWSSRAACMSSAQSGTSRAASTISCAGAAADMALLQEHCMHTITPTLNLILTSPASLAEQERQTWLSWAACTSSARSGTFRFKGRALITASTCNVC